MTPLLFWIIGLAAIGLIIWFGISFNDPTVVIPIMLWGFAWFLVYGGLNNHSEVTYLISATVTKGSKTVFVETDERPLEYTDAATYIAADKIKHVKVTKGINIYGGDSGKSYELVFE